MFRFFDDLFVKSKVIMQSANICTKTCFSKTVSGILFSFIGSFKVQSKRMGKATIIDIDVARSFAWKNSIIYRRGKTFTLKAQPVNFNPNVVLQMVHGIQHQVSNFKS